MIVISHRAILLTQEAGDNRVQKYDSNILFAISLYMYIFFFDELTSDSIPMRTGCGRLQKDFFSKSDLDSSSSWASLNGLIVLSLSR